MKWNWSFEMRIKEIAEYINATIISSSEDYEIQTLNYDSRKSLGSTSELFFAISGSKNDGHTYIKSLHDRGVRNFLTSKTIDLTGLENCNILQVKNTITALQKIAQVHRSHFDLPVIGITGSNGKTIVKEWLSTLLEKHFNVVKSPKSFNSQIGVPLSVWQLDSVHEVAIFEAGVSQAGEMESLQSVIHPTHGIFTNIGEAHAQGFQSLTEKIREKAKLFVDCKKIICRHQHQEIVEILSETVSGQVITWELNSTKGDVQFKSKKNGFEVTYGSLRTEFHTSFNNLYDLENIFHAIAMALVLEVPPQVIQEALSSIRSIPMRLELKRGVNDTYILDDTYNNDLLGLSTALDYLLQQPKRQKKTVILSDILQSGRAPEVLYQEVNTLLEKHKVDRLIGVGPEITQFKNVFSVQTITFPNTNALLKDMFPFHDELILIKGARDYNLEKVVAYLEEKNHGTVLEVNFEAITHNLDVYRQKLSPETKLMVMVKAFAYGVGVNEIAHLLQYHQVNYLGVAYLDEAIELRRKGITLPIMIMNPEANSFPLMETFNLEPEIYSLSMLKTFLEQTQGTPGIHLKIETGMHRLGFEEKDLSELISILKSNPQVKVKGIFSHLSSADDKQEDAYTEEQASKFEKAYASIASELDYKPIRHLLNSSGITRWPQYQFEMVRLGIGLYGYDSSGAVPELQPISSLKTRISQIKEIKAGDTIGYSRKGKAKVAGKIATLAIGYADGYSRVFSNGNAYVLINGQKAPTIGNVCMDMTMVDVTDLDVKEGDEVIVFGENPSIEDLAKWAKTIPYEILTNISQRVKRIFVSE